MNKVTAYIIKELSCPIAVCSLITLVSVTALAMALTSEVALGLEPCIMCIYQRIPFALATLLGLLGLAFRKRKVAVRAVIALSGLSFFINSLLAFYHSGIERHWWRSVVEGCVVPNFNEEPQSILENILSAPTARCDEIPWSDPFFGLSMANYNIALCLGMAALCIVSLQLIKRHPSH